MISWLSNERNYVQSDHYGQLSLQQPRNSGPISRRARNLQGQEQQQWRRSPLHRISERPQYLVEIGAIASLEATSIGSRPSVIRAVKGAAQPVHS